MATTVSPSAATVSPDMPLKMMTVSRNAAVVLDELTADLNVGDSRKMDRGLGYMPVHVECLHRSGLGDEIAVLLVAVGHAVVEAECRPGACPSEEGIGR